MKGGQTYLAYLGRYGQVLTGVIHRFRLEP